MFEAPAFPREPRGAVHPAAFGATLYVPALRDDLLPIATGVRYPALRSVVFDLEDAVRDVDTACALIRVEQLLAGLHAARAAHPGGPMLFVRPRCPEMLAQINHQPGVQALDGFVIPKATADVLPAYIAAMPFAHHLLMPTIETREAFDPVEMRRLRDQLSAIQDRVPLIRIGGNDLLQTLGTRRSTTRTAYDGPLGTIIGALVSTFVPWGFAMSAPVLETYTDMALLQAEIDRDIEHGLLTKTAIHPDQVAMIHAAYRVDAAELANARAILDAAAPAVFAAGGVMSEPATHRRWAAAIVTRAELFGVRKGEPLAFALVG